MDVIRDPSAQNIFDNYPKHVQKRMLTLRKLVLEAASKSEGVQRLEETLKWGEPSYLTKHGSTVRMDWKEKKPDQVAIYFKCTSKLVPTFKEIYGDLFTYEGNRALIFNLSDSLPKKQIKHCISLALNYHRVKHLPLLGASISS